MTIAFPHDSQAVECLPLFHGMPGRVVERLFARRHASWYDEGEVIFQEGDPARRFFVVLEGTVKIVRGREDGAEVLLNLLGKGDTIAECAFCASDRHSFSAESVTRSRLLAIDVDAVSACLAEDPTVASVLLRMQQRHLDMMMDQLEQMKLMSAAQRVAAFMLRLARNAGGAARVRLPYEKSLIAKLLGMNPESFSRALAKLKEVGLIVDGREVAIASTERLRRFTMAS